MQYRQWLLAGLCAQAGFVHAMGLGEMELKSHLGAPFQAELNLLSPADLTAQEVRVRIARSDVYNRMGARFEPFHNQIEFDVRPDAQGHLGIRAYSKNRVVEPFLDIVVELSWPSGTTYRRYNLLLDPPEYAARWQKPAVKSRAAPLEQDAMQLAARKVPPVVVPAPIPVQVGDETYRVRNGDSLWKIARQLSGSGEHTVHEWMAALYAANPAAFVQGDRNRLMLGATLQLPVWATETDNTQQVADYSQSATTPVPVTLPSNANLPATSVMPAHNGLDIQAELTSAEQAQSAAVPENLAELRAAIARLQQEKVELKEFQTQLKTDMQEVLEQRVAATEALLQAEKIQREMVLKQPVAVPAEETTVAVSEPVVTEIQAPAIAPVRVSAQPKPEPVGVADSLVASTPRPEISADPAPAASVLSELRVRDLMGGEEASHAELNASMAATDLLAPTPKLSNRLVSHGGPSLWYLLAMVPLGILVVLMGMRSHRVAQIRRSEQIKDENLHELVFGSRRDRSRGESPEQLKQALHQIREKADHAERQRQEQQAAEALEARDDLKQMIDLYLVYSQYQKALNVILTEITKRPSRPDLRLYLMQVYAEMGDWKAFEEQEEVLRRLGQPQLLDQAKRFRVAKSH